MTLPMTKEKQPLLLSIQTTLSKHTLTRDSKNLRVNQSLKRKMSLKSIEVIIVFLPY